MNDISSYATTLVVFGTVLLTSYYFLYGRKKLKVVQLEGAPPLNVPPCLPALPIFGSLPFLPGFPNVYKYFTKNQTKYEDVVAFYIMNDYSIILNSREAIHEAFVKRNTDFADRPISGANKFLNPNQKGILFHPYNENFKKYHKLGLGILRQLGFGNRVMEKRIMEDVVVLLNNLAAFEGKPFNPATIMANCSMNIICGMLFGKSFDSDDPHISDTILNVRKTFKNMPITFIATIIPLLKHFSFFNRALNASIEAQDSIFKMMEDKIVECTKERDINDNSDTPYKDSFIRIYIDKEGPDYDKEQLLHFMHELFLAGTETTASTLEWTFVLLANNKDVQDKMFEELQKVFPGNELPSLEKKKSLLYCEAVFHEILRLKNVAPLSVPHLTLRDTHVKGFYIPAGTFVLANFHSVHHNPNLWSDPERFLPERFLDPNNEKIIDKELLMSFSLGKRSCFGEILARQEIFLALTNLVKRFVILPPLGQSQVVVDEVMDVTIKPTPFQIRLIDRITEA